MLTDPIADMLTRIRNANRALHDSASMPTSRMKEEIARILKDEGYIKDYRVIEAADKKDQPLPYRMLVIELKFARDRRRVITDLKRVSKPGRRVYARTLYFCSRCCLTTSDFLAISLTAPFPFSLRRTAGRGRRGAHARAHPSSPRS